MKIPFLGTCMWKVHRGLQRLNKVSACSIQVCQGSVGINALNTFVLRVEHPYIVGKLEKPLDLGEPTFYAEKTACYRLQQQTKVHVLALAMQTTRKNCTKKHSIRAAVHRIRRFH